MPPCVPALSPEEQAICDQETAITEKYLKDITVLQQQIMDLNGAYQWEMYRLRQERKALEVKAFEAEEQPTPPPHQIDYTQKIEDSGIIEGWH